MGWILNSMVLLSALLLLVQAGVNGALSVETIAAYLVIIVVALAVLGRPRKKRRERYSAGRVLFAIGIPLTSLALFTINSSSGNWQEIGATITSIIAVLVALVGLLVILRSVFR